MRDLFFDFLPDAVLVADSQGVILKANAASEGIFGYLVDEFVGMRIEELLPERYRAVHARHLTSYFDSPSIKDMGSRLQIFGLRKDGTEVEVFIKLGPIPIAGGAAVALIRRVGGST